LTAVSGTFLNVLAIFVGGVAGLTLRRTMSPPTQSALKILLGVFTVYVGLSLTWQAVHGAFGQVLKELAVVLGALMLGHATGKLARLQRGFNLLGHHAKTLYTGARPDLPGHFGNGFVTCTILFCAAPLAVLGPMQEALTGDWRPLAIKAVMDGLATLAFAGVFGSGVLLAVLPVAAFQGLVWLGVKLLVPALTQHALLDSITATNGLLVFCVALIVFELKKVSLADYLPSLAFAPLLTWFLA
jgi:uncharacterized membrane protein YqgA involved in biofilm formation